MSLVAASRSRASALKRLAEYDPELVKASATRSSLFALFPIGYVFTAIYSDALFLALASGSFLAARQSVAP